MAGFSNSTDCCRFNWNIFPSTRLEASRMQTPVGCLFTPMLQKKQKDSTVEKECYPTKCSSCNAYINPYIKLDRENQMWWCPFCEKRSPLPPDIDIPSPNSGIQEWPVELRQTSTTVDYRLPEDISNKIEEDLPFVYLFVIDLYQHSDEQQDSPFENMIESIVASIENIPNGYAVGLISFDETVKVYSLLDSKLVTFDKNLIIGKDMESDFTKKESTDYGVLFDDEVPHSILKKLRASPNLKSSWKDSSLFVNNYLTLITPETRQQIINYLRLLKPRFANTYKPTRASGLAIYIASILLSRASFKNMMGKILFLTSGPCTQQPGLVLNLETKEFIRSHNDIFELKAPNVFQSMKFYMALSYVANGMPLQIADTIANSLTAKLTDFNTSEDAPRWSIDIFTFSPDQAGIYEMKSLASNTTGNIYMFESSASLKFKQSLRESVNINRTNARLKIYTSNSLKVQKLISEGHFLPSSFKQENNTYMYNSKISDTVTRFESASSKKNFTNHIALNTLSDSLTLAIFFEMDTARSSSELSSEGTKEVYIQFSMKYWDFKNRSWVMRITTIQKPTTLSILVKNIVKVNNTTTNKITSKLINSKSLKAKELALRESFDQECWTVLLTRLLIDRIDTTLGFDKFADLVGLLDDTLVKLLYNFCSDSLKVNQSQSNNPYDFELAQLSPSFKLLPTLIYNLRKNPQLIRIINSSPDETSYNHHWFLKLHCEKGITMIQPSLYKISKNLLQEVPLNSEILKSRAGTIFIMDSIFNIIVYFVTDTNSRLNLHPTKNDELLSDAEGILREPLKLISEFLPHSKEPISQIRITQSNHSQQRFLLARLDPVEKEVKLEMKKLSISEEIPSSFWSLFKRPNKKIEKTYDILMTDDINSSQYYAALLNLIKSCKVED